MLYSYRTLPNLLTKTILRFISNCCDVNQTLTNRFKDLCAILNMAKSMDRHQLSWTTFWLRLLSHVMSAVTLCPPSRNVRHFFEKIVTLCPPSRNIRHFFLTSSHYVRHLIHFINFTFNSHLKFDVTKYLFILNKITHCVRRHWTYLPIILINKSVTLCLHWTYSPLILINKSVTLYPHWWRYT